MGVDVLRAPRQTESPRRRRCEKRARGGGLLYEDVDVRIGGQLLGHTSPSSRAIAWRRLGSGKKEGRGFCSGGFDPAADWRLPVSAGQ